MKKCFYFPTWKEEKQCIMISLDYSCIFISNIEGKTVYNKLTRMIDCDYYCDSEAIEQTTPSDPILAKLCEKTGAKMYGDYIVLDKINLYCRGNYNEWNKYNRFSGDLIEYDSRECGCMCNQKFEHCKGCLKLCNKEYEKAWYCYNSSDWFTNETICNILQEYSKFLRNEENKWLELKDLIDL